jgi:hypothetical protein
VAQLVSIDEYLEANFSERSRPKKQTIWRWIRAGKIPALKMGRSYYIDPDKVDPDALVRRILGK